MLTSQTSWFNRIFPPLSDTERARRLRLLRIILFSMLAASGFYSLVGVLTAGQLDPWWQLSVVLLAMLLITVLLSQSRRYYYPVAVATIVMVWCIIASSALLGNRIASPGYPVLIVPMVVAAALLGAWISLLIMTANILLGLLFTQMMLDRLSSPIVYTPGSLWAVQSIIFLLIGIIQFFVVRSLNTALAVQQHSRQQLVTQNAVLERANRSYRMLSDCNQMLMRARDEDALLHDLCRIIVDIGQYAFAWVGFAEHDAARSVLVGAAAGANEDFLRQNVFSWAEDAPGGRGPFSTAVRENRTVIVPDIHAETLEPQWRELALAHGFRLVIALPLRLEQRVIGGLVIYGAGANLFPDNERKLLEELAGDLAFGIATIRARQERALALAEVQRLNAELEQRVAQRTAELAARTAQLEIIIRNYPGGYIGLFDRDLRYLRVGGARLFERGFTPGDLEGKTIFETLPPEMLATTEADYRAALQGESVTNEITVAGNTFLTRVHPVREPDGSINSAIVILQDIAAQKQVETLLREALEQQQEVNQLRSRLVAMLSHDFRTPLSVVLMSSSMLLDHEDRLDSDQRAKRLLGIQSAVRELTMMLDEVLAVGRGETLKFSYEPQSLDCVQTCAKLVEAFQQSTTTHRLNFSSDLPERVLLADRRLLQQMLNNLLSNAVKYSPNASVVEIALRVQDPAQWSLSVRDYGIGINPDEVLHLFEFFWRGSNVGGIKGTGLGLAIVRQAVDAHGGSITCESTPGAGSTFTITLPAQPVQV